MLGAEDKSTEIEISLGDGWNGVTWKGILEFLMRDGKGKWWWEWKWKVEEVECGGGDLDITEDTSNYTMSGKGFWDM